jgi:hypothetical protein
MLKHAEDEPSLQIPERAGLRELERENPSNRPGMTVLDYCRLEMNELDRGLS